ncbi:DnaD domain-containing protein [Paenibacillus sp. GCM10023248]|uniref:DnaD domain-containing protein n=1 Tax=Bacillales TaxID=1385 RepID=UPI00237909A7|nr:MULTISPECIES: DnaD domain protein [Bacillales]MDD9267692.1 DnaD domain protein [Paenibacillus sp. MAHUQ-63]MDR6884504.1 DNA replication protein [Bacillus sp. 3255]
MSKPYVMQQQIEAVLLASFQEGSVAVPLLLLKNYRALQLSEIEVMTLIHLIAFLEKEKNDFPTTDEIQARMSASPDLVIASLQKLIHEQFITIDEVMDEMTEIRSERYNLTPLYRQLAKRLAEQEIAKLSTVRQPVQADESARNIFTTFEKEFARPLTPMELETISGWLDKDQYKEELIMTALKEAVFAGKVHFRYIDRILLEWSRNRVGTVDQAKEYSQRFRQSR